MGYIEDNFELIRNIKLAKFRLKLEAVEEILLPEYKGSTFRGLLGWRLKEVLCVNKNKTECKNCILLPKCLCNYLFSPILPEDTQFLKNTSNIPSPIIIEPPLTTKRHFEQGNTLEMKLVLIGKGLEYLPYLIYVFTEMGNSGIGSSIYQKGKKKRGGKFELIEVYDDIGGTQIYSITDNTLHDNYQVLNWNDAIEETSKAQKDLSMEFLTPARLKEMRGDNLKLSKLRNFSQIITNLYWRLLLLAYFHCNPWNLKDERFKELSKEASQQRRNLMEIEDVKIEENHTYWQEYERWSNRQNTKMFLGGFMGKATFSGNLTPYLPLLYLGEYTHIGKQTMFGLGKYEIKRNRM